jgi:hypothetical protein
LGRGGGIYSFVAKMDVGIAQLYQAMRTVAATAAAIHRPLRSANRPRDDSADYADWHADYVTDEKSWFSNERVEERRFHSRLARDLPYSRSIVPFYRQQGIRSGIRSSPNS